MYKNLKNCFDFILSLGLFIIISPVFLILYSLVRINLGSPVFFKQKRSGKGQQEFDIIKFRTMTDERDQNGKLLPDDVRVTKFGKWLRSSSIDELPELLCIIKGDMSVIGPRPLPPSYDQYYTERERKRFDVRGGLIPPDSVDTSAIVSWDKQLEYEAKYAEELSFRNDIRILIFAVKMLITRHEMDYGAYVRQSLIDERKER